MCVLCVQGIAANQRELQDPSTNAERRRRLQERVQHFENLIKSLKSDISSFDADIKQHQAAMAALQGEPFCVAIATVEFYFYKLVAMPTRCLVRRPAGLADGHAHLHGNHVAMVTNLQLQLS